MAGFAARGRKPRHLHTACEAPLALMSQQIPSEELPFSQRLHLYPTHTATQTARQFLYVFGDTGHMCAWNRTILHIFALRHRTPWTCDGRLFTRPVESNLARIYACFITRNQPCE